MIKVTKSEVIPSSLQTTQSYSGQDVRHQLREDHRSICYLCDRERDTDFEIEHFRSKQHFPLLKTAWSNLLFSCSYCNNKKSDKYDNLLNPLENNIEEMICQEMDLKNNRAKFSCVATPSDECVETIELLDKIYNGNNGLRDKDNEEVFFNCVKAKYNSFLALVTNYVFTPSDELRDAVIEELILGKELLGLKYWIIKRNNILWSEFAKYIVWNK